MNEIICIINIKIKIYTYTFLVRFVVLYVCDYIPQMTNIQQFLMAIIKFTMLVKCMRLTNKVIFKKCFSENYKHMHLSNQSLQYNDIK